MKDIWENDISTVHQQLPYYLTDMLVLSCQFSVEPAKKPDATEIQNTP